MSNTFFQVVQMDDSLVMVMLKKETLDHLRKYIESMGKIYTIDKIDDAVQEWVNWQIKADEEAE